MANLFRLVLGRGDRRHDEPDPDFAAFLCEIAQAAPCVEGVATISFGHLAGGDRIFPFHAAMAILLARQHHPSASLLLFCEQEPEGMWWDLIRDAVRWCRVPSFSGLNHGLARLERGRMLLVRLIVLRALGGVFAATDMWILRKMDHLGRHSMVLGVQAGAPVTRFAFGEGMASALPGNEFCRIWLDACLADMDSSLDELACRLPVRLYAADPEMVRVLPHTAWFSPAPQRIRHFLFSENADVALDLCADSLALPLWSELLKEALVTWTVPMLDKHDCLFSRLCREVLPQDCFDGGRYDGHLGISALSSMNRGGGI